MSRWKQAVHVAWKDIRQQRWFLLAFAVVVALATWSAVADTSAALGNAVYVLLVAVIATALFVQADSPTRTDAAWAVLPLDPLAVLGGKLIAIVTGIVAVGVAGQAVVLVALRLPVPAIPGALGGAAAMYVLALLPVALVAASVPDLKSFLIAEVVLLIATQFYVAGLRQLMFVSSGPDRLPPSPWVSALLGIAMLMALAHMYRSRRLAHAVALTALILIADPLAPAISDLGTGRLIGAPAGESIPDSLRPHVTFDSTFGSHYFESVASQYRLFSLPLRVAYSGPPRWFALIDPVITLEAPDGAASRFVPQEPAYWMVRGPVPLGDGIGWARAADTAAVPDWFAGSLMSPIDYLSIGVSTRRALAAFSVPGTRVVLTGRVEAYDVRTVARLPLQPGATYVGNGKRVVVDSAWPAGDGPHVTVRLTTAVNERPNTSGSSIGRWKLFGYALVNTSEKRALPIAEYGGTSSMRPLVLGDGSRQTIGLQYLITGQKYVVPSGEWLSGAKLWLLDWDPVASFPVRIETVLKR